MARAMHPEICSMRVAEAAKRQRCIDTNGLARGLTELWAGKHGAIIGEADQALVEGGVPQGRKQESVVDVKALLVAIGPGPPSSGFIRRQNADGGPASRRISNTDAPVLPIQIERHWQDSAASTPRPPRACCFAEATARD